MKIFIPFNVPSSKNSRVWTGKFSVTSKTVTKWKKATAFHWINERPIWFDMVKDTPYPIKLQLTFVRGNKHRFDYNNMANTVLDEMVRHGWIEDDNADIIIPSFAPYLYDKEKPGVFIEII